MGRGGVEIPQALFEGHRDHRVRRGIHPDGSADSTLESISFERRRGTWQEEVTWDNPVRLGSEGGAAGMPSDCPGQVIQV